MTETMPAGGSQTSSSAAPRGRPVLGAVLGLLFGIFVTFDLLMLTVFPLDSVMVLVIPLALLVVGGVWGYFAPLRFLRR